jgi:hypothetical protein
VLVPTPPARTTKPLNLQYDLSIFTVIETIWKFAWNVPKGIQIDKNDVLKYTKADGSNPCVLTSKSFSSYSNHIRIKVIKMGTFVVIGASLQGENQSVAYYSQPSGSNGAGIHHIVRTGLYFIFEMLIKVGQRPRPASPINNGDIIDMCVDSRGKRMHFWLNEIYEGCVLFEYNIVETLVFPSVTLGDSTEVTIVNNAVPKLITDPYKTLGSTHV